MIVSAPSWNETLILQSVIALNDDIDFETFNLFMKAPPSSDGIRLDLIGVNFPFKVIPERWSTLYRMDIPSEAFQTSNSKVRANIAFDLTFALVNKNRITKGVGLSELSDRYPLNDSDPHTDYLQPHRLVESDSKEINDQANQIVSPDSDLWEVTRKLADWINEYIVYSYDLQGASYRGALATLRDRRGTCSDFVHLFLALTRAIGIPTRAMIGINRQGRRRKWTLHSWAEVLDPEYGWVPIDLVTQPIKFVQLGNDYIPISAGFNCENRFYAYYFTPTIEDVDLTLRQYATINRDTVEIEFFDE